MMRITKRFSILLLATVLLLGLFAGFSQTAVAAPVDITAKFTDLSFRAAVYEVIGKKAPAVIFDTDVADISVLVVTEESTKSLAGLEYFTGLTTFWCWNTELTSMPILPAGLVNLSCINNQLASLPELPTGLTVLDCGNNQLTSLPALPSGLTRLSCGGNQLKTLPTLPSGLEILFCGFNRLTSLPELPSGLTWLSCGVNQLTSLPALPSGLESLSCGFNRLTSLPALPSGLTDLDCGDNQLTSLPALPPGITRLSCSWNQLKTLPTLPSSLAWLICKDNQLTSLPPLPAGLVNLQCSANQLATLDVSGLKNLVYMNCTFNSMTSPSAVKGFTGVWDGLDFCFAPQNISLPPPTGMSDWAKAEVNSLFARVIWYDRPLLPLPLQNNFQKPICRDEFTALLVSVYEYAGYMAMPKETPFTDITDNPYKTAISYAYDIGLIDGTSPTTFSPGSLLTREQTAKLLFTIVDLIDGAKLSDDTPDFADNANISSWAVPYVAYAQAHKLMQGKSGGIFDPNGNLTREEAILVVERLIVQYGWK